MNTKKSHQILLKHGDMRFLVTCMSLMLHAHVAHCSDGLCSIILLSSLPDGKEWRVVIGFDPIRHFSPVSAQDVYSLKDWARTGTALPSEIPLPCHPHDPSKTVPYGAVVYFVSMPVSVVPTAVLL